jgi:hypothetical protein
MPSGYRYLSSLLLAAAFFVPAVTLDARREAIALTILTLTTITGGIITKPSTTINGSSKTTATIATFVNWTASNRSNTGTGGTIITTITTMIMIGTKS